MSYVKGQVITAADFNALVSSIQNVYGTGYGDSGYGQTQNLVPARATGGLITGADWSNFKQMVAICAVQQGTSLNSPPPASSFNSGQLVQCFEQAAPTSSVYELQQNISSLIANRFTCASGNQVTSPSVSSVVRGGSWGQASNQSNSAAPSTWTGWGSIALQVNAVWPSEDQARFFFNAGGVIFINLSHPNTSTAQDSDWQYILQSKIKTICFACHNTYLLGNMGVMSTNRGYYENTGVLNLNYNGANIGDGAYTVNDVALYTGAYNVNGANGGNGNTVSFILALNDQHSNSFYDSVNAGTTATFGYSLPGGNLTGIQPPTFNTVTNW